MGIAAKSDNGPIWLLNPSYRRGPFARPCGRCNLGLIRRTTLPRRTIMPDRATFGAFALAAALLMPAPAAFAFDEAKYLDLNGQWAAVRLPVGGQPAFDPTKAWGHAQQAPLTAEYQ